MREMRNELSKMLPGSDHSISFEDRWGIRTKCDAILTRLMQIEAILEGMEL
jgi:hypothetical protein